MIRKILKWTGIILGSIILLFAFVVASRQELRYDAPYPLIKASDYSISIARGKYLVFGPAHCASCHSTKEMDELVNKGLEVPLSGARKFELPIGTVYSRNITPDKQTGIGSMTDAEIARALRYGVRADGSALLDFMPFHNTSDEDLSAIISYLRAQQPVSNKVPEQNWNIVGRIVKAFLIKPVGPDLAIVKTMNKDTTAVYGKYLSYHVADCYGCHTERSMMTGKFIGEPFAGGTELESEIDPVHYTFITPNLTPDNTGRLKGWTIETFRNRFRMGKIIPGSPMPWGSFRNMNDEDLIAIYNYLKTVRPVKNELTKTMIKK